MDGNRDSNTELIHNCIHLSCNIPVIDGTIGGGTSLGLSDFYDNSRVCPLRSPECATDHKLISAVGSYCHRLSLFDHGPVYDLAADNQSPGIGE